MENLKRKIDNIEGVRILGSNNIGVNILQKSINSSGTSFLDSRNSTGFLCGNGYILHLVLIMECVGSQPVKDNPHYYPYYWFQQSPTYTREPNPISISVCLDLVFLQPRYVLWSKCAIAFLHVTSISVGPLHSLIIPLPYFTWICSFSLW